MNERCATTGGGARDDLVSDHFDVTEEGDIYGLAV